MATAQEVMPSKFNSLQTGESIPLASWNEFERLITCDKNLQYLTETYRKRLVISKKFADELKPSSPCITTSALMDGYGKKLENVVKATHVLALDYDNLPPEKLDGLVERASLIASTMCVYRTISGRGIRIFVRYAACEEKLGLSAEEFFKMMYRQAMEFYDWILGAKADRQCCDFTRSSGMASDPKGYFHWNAEAMQPSEESILKAFHPDSAPSEAAPKKRRATRRKTTQSSKKGAPTMEEAAPHIKQLMEKWGIKFEPSNHNHYVTTWAFTCLKYGIDYQEALSYANQEFGTEYEQTASVVKSCYKHSQLLGTWHFYREGETYGKRPNVKVIKQWLSTRYEFHHNVITGRYEISSRIILGGKYPRPTFIDVNIENSLWAEMAEDGLNVHMADLHAIINSDFSTQIDPLDDYLKSLPEWDGTDHIALLAKRIHIQEIPGTSHTQEKLEYYLRKWFVAMVVAWVNPKVVNQTILILIGKGGIYKTTLFNYLLPPVLRDYYMNDSSACYTDKDTMEALACKALVCLDEFETAFGKNLSAFKSNITKLVFSIRRPYDKYRSELLHHATLGGTSNVMQVISDEENRRYSPWLVESIDSPISDPINYQQLYAQAVVLGKEVSSLKKVDEKRDWVYWLTKADIAEMRDHNKMFMVTNYLEEQVLKYYRIPNKNTAAQFIKFRYNAEILERICTNPAMRQNCSNQSIGNVMSRLGFPRAHKAKGNGWWVIEMDGAEINSNAMFDPNAKNELD